MRSVWVLAALVLVAWLALGQAPATAPAADNGKIAIVNSERVLAESNEGKAAQADLQRRFQQRQTDLQARATELERLQAEYQQKAATFTPAEQQRRGLDIQNRQKKLERDDQDFQSDFNAAREEVLGRLGKQVSEVVQKYGAQKGYHLIMDAGQAGTLYASPAADISNEIMAAYNAQSPKPAAAPAAPPAAKKP